MSHPDYSALTKLDMAIRAAREFHLPPSREWKDLNAIILEAIGHKIASQPPPSAPPPESSSAPRQQLKQKKKNKK